MLTKATRRTKRKAFRLLLSALAAPPRANENAERGSLRAALKSASISEWQPITLDTLSRRSVRPGWACESLADRDSRIEHQGVHLSSRGQTKGEEFDAAIS